MKIKFILTLLAVGICFTVHSQNRFYTKTAVIKFTAGTALEDIDAINKSVASVIEVSSGQVEIAVLIKGFEFRRGLMQEHFNENYMESEKFPKATFKGKIARISEINFKKDGTYPAVAEGPLEIHGIKKVIKVPITLTIVDGKLAVRSTFQVNLEDYKITIPGAVKDKISPTVSIQVAGDYKPL